MKVCKKCGEQRPLSKFLRHKSGNLGSVCQPCRYAASKAAGNTDYLKQLVDLVCPRCGVVQKVQVKTLDTRSRRGTDDLCFSCTMKPAKQITYNWSKCVPWRGEFDDFDNPVERGNWVRPGKRVCGHRDCVAVSHIEPLPFLPDRDEVLVSRAWLNGRELSMQDLVNRLAAVWH